MLSTAQNNKRRHLRVKCEMRNEKNVELEHKRKQARIIQHPAGASNADKKRLQIMIKADKLC